MTEHSSSNDRVGPGKTVVLAGGVGAARFLRGVVRAIPPSDVTVIVNTGDDRLFYGVHVSPDIDIVTYTLAGLIDGARGFGLAGDTFRVVDQLGALGQETWFRLGDLDYANCLDRTLRFASGDSLDQVTERVRKRLGLEIRILPMSNDPCPTFVDLDDGTSIHFEEYLVRDRAPTNVRGVDLAAAREAAPAPGVVDAIGAADTILVCPSNPIVSIDPILSVSGVTEAIQKSRAPVVAVSPIVSGAPIKGPAHTLLAAAGIEVSAVGVAGFYREWIDGFVFDVQDRPLGPRIEALGIQARCLDTMMVDAAVSESVARAATDLASQIRAQRQTGKAPG